MGVHETYELHVGQDVFTLRVEDGLMQLERGSTDAPVDVVCEADFDTLMALGVQRLTAADAVRSKRMKIRERSPAVDRMHEIFLGPVPAPV